MAVQPRTIQNKRDANGVLTGKSGTVYDVNIKYNAPMGRKTYTKRGFATKKEVLDAYHNVLHPKPTEEKQSEAKSPKKKSRDMEL